MKTLHKILFTFVFGMTLAIAGLIGFAQMEQSDLATTDQPAVVVYDESVDEIARGHTGVDRDGDTRPPRAWR
ncbi:MAG: hypothetical protein AAF902_25635 [Chloroflexota bacterium]